MTSNVDRGESQRGGLRPRLLIFLLVAAFLAAATTGSQPALASSHELVSRKPMSAADGDLLYVPSAARDSLTIIDTRTGRVASQEPFGDNPVVTVLTPDRTRFYAVNFFRRSMEVRDNRTGTSARVDLPANPWALLLAPDERHLVIPLANDTVVFVDTHRGDRIDKTIRLAPAVPLFGALSNTPLPFPPTGAISVEVSPDGKILYVGYGTGLIDAYDIATGRQVRARIVVDSRTPANPFGSPAYPAWFALSSDGRSIFSLNALGDDVTVIDTATWKLVKRIPISLAITAVKSPTNPRHMYFAGRGGLTLVDTQDLEILSTLDTPGIATSIALSSDGRTGYLARTSELLLAPLDLLALAGLGQLMSIGPGKVQKFDALTMQPIGKSITVPSVPAVLAWTDSRQR